ncbi:uncharacterized protein LOC134546640 isoform X2 [Prinia subflava]|uniref:uncharacterized protein LOC134546640 isoform X2 n=1 Tax=Prinia subflava TaxID=208062 RepID=UPI002FDF0AF4
MSSVRGRSRSLLALPPISDGAFRRPAPHSRRPRPPGHTRHRHRCDGPGAAAGAEPAAARSRRGDPDPLLHTAPHPSKPHCGMRAACPLYGGWTDRPDCFYF